MISNYQKIDSAIRACFSNMRYEYGCSHASHDNLYYYLDNNQFFTGRLFSSLAAIADSFNLSWYVETVQGDKFMKFLFTEYFIKKDL